MTRQTTVEVTVDLVVEVCINCGMSFGVPAAVIRQRKRDHVVFYCPAGHSQYYPGESDEEKLRRLLKEQEQATKQAEYQAFQERKRRESEQLAHEHTRRSLTATRGVLTKTKNRIANGVCPCCRRSFGNLQRHMSKQHPEYTQEAPV